jgi:hypothetical protein
MGISLDTCKSFCKDQNIKQPCAQLIDLPWCRDVLRTRHLGLLATTLVCAPVDYESSLNCACSELEAIAVVGHEGQRSLWSLVRQLSSSPSSSSAAKRPLQLECLLLLPFVFGPVCSR